MSYREISESEHKKFRPKVKMGGPVFKNGKDVSKQIERQTLAKHKALEKAKKPSSFISRLEAHKAEGASFDNGKWKPKKKGQSFIQALEEHKSHHEFD